MFRASEFFIDLIATGNLSVKSLCQLIAINSFKGQSHKMVKHTQTICRILPTNCVSVFDHFVYLAFKGLIYLWRFPYETPQIYYQFYLFC